MDLRESLLVAFPRSYNAYTLGDGGGGGSTEDWATSFVLDNSRMLTVRCNSESITLGIDETVEPLHLLLPSGVSGRPDIVLRPQSLIVAVPCGKSVVKVTIQVPEISISEVKTIEYSSLESEIDILADGGSFAATTTGRIFVLDDRGRSEEIFSKGKHQSSSSGRGFLRGKLFGAEKKSNPDRIVLTKLAEDSQTKTVLFVTSSGSILAWHLQGPGARPVYLRHALRFELSTSRRSEATALDGSTFVLGVCTDQADSCQNSAAVVSCSGPSIQVQEKVISSETLTGTETIAGVAKLSSTEARIVYSDGSLQRVSTMRTEAREEEVWSLTDDLSEEGCWRKTDTMVSSVEDVLFSPGRFTDAAIAKAIQVPLEASVSRRDLTVLVKEFIKEQEMKDPGRDKKDILAQVIRRATRATVATEARIIGAGTAPQGMSSIIRGLGVSVLRPCLRQERAYLLAGRSGQMAEAHAVDESSSIATGSWAWMLAGVSALQVVSCEDQEGSSAIPILRRPSDANMDLGLASIAARYVQENLERQGEDISEWSFESCLQEICSTMVPAPLLLRFLVAIQEYSTLAEAATRTAERLPASSHFAAGISALSDYSLRYNPKSLAEPEIRRQADAEADEILNMFLDGASALPEQPKDSEDIQTIEKLVGLSDILGSDKESLEFWYRERVVRMLESVRAIKGAATAAVDAMQYASTRRNYGVMRSVVFQRFLDIGDVEKALAAVLYPPFRPRREDAREHFKDFWTEDEADEALSLRDMIGSITNAVLAAGKLEWFASCALPETVSSAVKIALLRMARSSDVIAMLGSGKSPYEDVMAWDMVRGDTAGVAASAYEWARRLLEERVHGTKLDLWTQGRASALSSALGALKLFHPNQQIIPTTLTKGTVLLNSNPDEMTATLTLDESDAMMEDEEVTLKSPLTLDELLDAVGDSKVPVVGAEHLERLSLLANAQAVIIARDGTDGAEPPLEENIEAVEYAIARLCFYQQVEPATRLAIAWANAENSENLTVQVARASASTAVILDKWNLLDSSLSLLQDWPRTTRNYSFIALEGVLAASGGALSPPQWLIDQAAGKGNLAQVVPLLLRYGCNQDACNVLMAKIHSSHYECFGYNAADALLAQLKTVGDTAALDTLQEAIKERVSTAPAPT
uniref:Uncharacterized protein n=4 Tax=Rhodosorus marinus TaxID=101924 RepID=A0A7S2ZVC3_9RHOD|mmetsp:Transcript_32238/g.126069  ORF Transcript_32238/g.126069 Transcript_32238/m.126069 type:complete len:1151 (+) Transcript_32238:340-3792(+)